MKKISFCSILLLFSIQGFANITCNEQYGGGYNCYNFETGQSQTININSYPDNDIQPVPMPDLSSLPDPTAMMSMDASQVNEMFNPQPIAPMTIQPSPSVNMVLQNTQQQANAQIAEANRMQQQHLQAIEQRRAEEQRAYEFNMQLAQQMQTQKAQQQSSQSNTQNAGDSIHNTDDSQSSNISNNNHNSDIKNYIIGVLIFIIAIMLGIFWQKNTQN